MKKKELSRDLRRVGEILECHGHRIDTLEAFANNHSTREDETTDRLDSLAMEASILRNKLRKLEEQIADIELMRKRIDELEKLFPELVERLDKASSANFDKWSLHEERLGRIEQQIELLRKTDEFEKAGSEA